MSITLGLNISSLKSQRELANSSDQLASVFERLSSGQRINKASDDAAGLAIADSLRADTRVFNQGVRNLNDGISLLNIADSAIEGLSNIVIRLQELAEQSANGVYGDTQRAALDAEAQALRQEYLRVSKSVEFNGKNLLNGDTTSVQLQAGIGSNAILQLGVGGAIGDGTFETSVTLSSEVSLSTATADFNGDGNADLLSYQFGTGMTLYAGQGDGTFDSGTVVDSGANVGEIEVTDFNGDGNLDFVIIKNSNEIVSFLGNGDGSFASGVTTTSTLAAVDNVDSADFNGDGILDLVAVDKAAGYAILYGDGDGTFTTVQTQSSIIIDDIHAADYDGDGDIDLFSLKDSGGQFIIFGQSDGTVDYGSAVAVGDLSSNTDSISVDIDDDGLEDIIDISEGLNAVKVFLNNGDGTFDQSNYTVGADAFSAVRYGDFNGDGIYDLVTTEAAAGEASVLLGNSDGTFSNTGTYQTGTSLTYTISVNDYNNDGVLDVVAGGTSLHFLQGSSIDGVAPLLDFDLSTITGAKQALPRFQQKLTQLSSQRSEIGSHLSRIQTASNNLTVAAENYKAAEGRIRDADIALESSNLVRLNILQQAASAVLAQANLQPELALRLLR